jgi:hypothetical protein
MVLARPSNLRMVDNVILPGARPPEAGIAVGRAEPSYDGRFAPQWIVVHPGCDGGLPVRDLEPALV